jgi:hypothetical protein
MASLRHLFPQRSGSAEPYQYPHKVGGGEFDVPPRDRAPHAATLQAEVLAAASAATEQRAAEPSRPIPKGIVLDFRSDPGFKLKLESLDFRPSGIELRSARIDQVGMMHASVFVPEGKVTFFIKRLEQYAGEDTDGATPKAKHKDLIESISEVRLASLESFWRDAGAFPGNTTDQLWWEVWLADLDATGNAAAEFRRRAAAAGATVSERVLRFPERHVLLAKATAAELAAIENLFDLLAELRLAKLLPGEFLALAPYDQAEFVEDARARITLSAAATSSVCQLDTGVNRGHPLLERLVAAEHLLSVDPSWSPADLSGHGTEMAGLALFGCLTKILGSSGPIELRHCLESVKILPDGSANDPELWGQLTQQAASRIEIAAPERSQRAYSLTVTAEGRDDGAPSSWSAAIDQLCVAGDESPPRLLIVSAGNLPLEDRHNYPARNEVEGIEDPAQSWNALTVGAYTQRSSIGQTDYSGWRAVAPSGGLSPASRTSLIWSSKTWPIKPDVLMEGGNVAVNPATGKADFVDDLSLLTTRASVTGGLLTTTGDTSAATALAGRFAARLWAEYPLLRPETIRALMVHSARWTKPMIEMAAGNQEWLLRCCGYGVPDFELACWSASNKVTLVIESSLQPYQKTPTRVTSHEMHLHRLPWPTAVLQQLLDSDVRMRVTLSYFIEPSPGRRGWTRKHRYQSHGLRFDVKRPEESDDDFRKRVSKAARDEDEEVDGGSDDREWLVGAHYRCKGSIHSDTWQGTAAQLAASGVIAVFPVTGWWKERPHLLRYNRPAPYSLVVSIETDSVETDLYTPIANQIALQVTS